MSALLKAAYRWIIRRKLNAAVRARRLVTVSEYTKSRLLSLFPFIDPSSVAVLNNGVRFTDYLSPKNRTPGSHFPLELLCTGGLDERRKNYAALMRNLPAVVKNRVFHLRLVGKCTPSCRKFLLSEIPSPDMARSVVFDGVVSDKILRGYYATADFFLVPSLAEGFGLPLVEAMAHGAVVCAFKNTSIPEICGDAAVLAENNDFAFWGREMDRLMEEPEAYKNLAQKAQLRARDFSEQKMFDRYQRYIKAMLKELVPETDSK